MVSTSAFRPDLSPPFAQVSVFRPRRSRDWSLTGVGPLPGPSLFDHATRLVAEHGDGPLPRGGEPLPDEPPPDPSKLRYGPGVMDGIGAGAAGPGESQPAVIAASAILDLLQAVPSTKKVHAVAARLAEVESPSSFDQLLETLKTGGANRARLAELSRWLCTHGTHRQQVKAGIAMLGVSGAPDDTALVNTLGRLEELTLYSLVALSNLQPDKAEQAIFDLARQVEGWGRIHALYRLAGTSDPTIKAWMLRGGYVNGVMDEEVAYIAASTGGLEEALAGAVDEELLDWSGRLLVALAIGGPAKDMTHYADGATALASYLREVGNVSATLLRLQHLYDIERYLTGWAVENPLIDDGTREALSAQVTEILNRPDWPPLVAGGLVSTDVGTVKAVLRLAPRYELDPVPVVLDWLPAEPHDAYLWQIVLAAATADNIDELVELAGRVLPWSAIKTGPAKDFGLGPDYRAEACLDQILQRLDKFPGHGWAAIEVGLTCRVTRNRNLAIRALDEWPRDAWPEGAQGGLRRLLFQEPDDKARQRVKDLLGQAADEQNK